MSVRRRPSLRRQLLLGILLPVAVLIAFNTLSLYRQALFSINLAYDRTLLASAKSIGELLDVTGYDDLAQVRATVPYAALEAFEADNQSRMSYRVSSPSGEMISGFAEVPFWRGTLPVKGPYAALVDFYDDRVRDEAVRVAVLLQPVASANGRGMAVVQVAETLELRTALARRILVDTLWRQLLLAAVIAAVVWIVVQRTTRPIRRLSAELCARPADDLRGIDAPDAPRELEPLVTATDQTMRRLAALVAHQKRFVRDASHQLRTPLAVLKTQVQSARRGDLPASLALAGIEATVDGATRLANQMLALAKIEQLRGDGPSAETDAASLVREVALDLAPLIAERGLDFSIATTAAPIRAHEWMVRELARNLLHNAIRHSPAGGRLSVRVHTAEREVEILVADDGPGFDPSALAGLSPAPGVKRGPAIEDDGHGAVASNLGASGSGLGLSICRGIVGAIGGTLALENRTSGGHIRGLDAMARLPRSTPASTEDD